MTTPSNASKNLLLARWLYSAASCKGMEDGRAFVVPPSEDVRNFFFDIDHPHDCARVMVKLKFEHNITIHERKRGGKTIWEAVTHGENMRGSHEHADLAELLAQVVEGLQNG